MMPKKSEKPFVLTLFGASGDLAKLKVYPSLFELFVKQKLPADFWIIGYARSLKSHENHRNDVKDALNANMPKHFVFKESQIDEFLAHVYAFKGSYDKKESFSAYEKARNEICGSQDAFAEEIAYLSVPPSLFEPITQQMGQLSSQNKQKVIIEKPFGTNEATAKALYLHLQSYYSESQLFLLDHYLGKDAVRSILPLRHHNRLLNLMLKGKEIKSVQINALEPMGVEERLGYFDKVGTVRDMIQSHLMQILALITMSIPTSMKSEDIRREKATILSALRFEPAPENVVLGQYEGYCNNTDVCSPFTPTFAALKLHINRESWHGVPILLRSGKYLKEKQTYITIELKKFGYQDPSFPANRIVFELSPNEQLHLKLYSDENGTPIASFGQGTHNLMCKGDCLSEHGTLILDALHGNQTHFLSFSEIIACWRVIDEVLAFTSQKKPETYEKNSHGPEKVKKLGKFWEL